MLDLQSFEVGAWSIGFLLDWYILPYQQTLLDHGSVKLIIARKVDNRSVKIGT